MKVKLTSAFYDGKKVHPAGTILDLPVPPKSAKLVEEPKAEKPQVKPAKED